MCVLASSCASLVLISSNEYACISYVVAVVFLLFFFVAQALFVGGIFTQFSRNSDGNYVVDQGGVRSVSATQIAIERVNNKSDGVFDHLLPNTQVLYLYAILKI